MACFRLLLVGFLGLVTAAPPCEQLKLKAPGAIVSPSDSNYLALSQGNWAATSRNTPGCIAVPSTGEQLQAIVSTLISKKIQFAIRGGGHAVAPNASNIDGQGVLVDMRNLTKISYDEKKTSLTIGAGLRWGEVYKFLAPYNLTVIGGRNDDVGVAGLTLGGGLAYNTDKYGMVCDNVLNFEVLLSNGSLVNANASSYSDLFRALKGGSNNFGIVASMTLKVYPQGPVWAGIRLYSREQLPALVSAMAEYQASSHKDPDANLMIQAPVTFNEIGGVLNFIHGKGKVEPEAFRPFSNIPFTTDTIQLQTFAEFITSQIMVDTNVIPRWDFRTTAFKLNATTYLDVLDAIFNASEIGKISNISSGALNLGWQPISAAVADIGEANGGNSLGIESEPQSWVSLNTGWLNNQDDETIYAASRAILARIEEVTKRDGAYLEYQFMNDASWDQDVIEHYGKEKVDFLKRVNEKYDPKKVFQKLVPGGWKLP